MEGKGTEEAATALSLFFSPPSHCKLFLLLPWEQEDKHLHWCRTSVLSVKITRNKILVGCKCSTCAVDPSSVCLQMTAFFFQSYFLDMAFQRGKKIFLFS